MGCGCKKRSGVAPQKKGFCVRGPEGEQLGPFPRIYEARVKKKERGAGWRVVSCNAS